MTGGERKCSSRRSRSRAGRQAAEAYLDSLSILSWYLSVLPSPEKKSNGAATLTQPPPIYIHGSSPFFSHPCFYIHKQAAANIHCTLVYFYVNLFFVGGWSAECRDRVLYFKNSYQNIFLVMRYNFFSDPRHAVVTCQVPKPFFVLFLHVLVVLLLSLILIIIYLMVHVHIYLSSSFFF